MLVMDPMLELMPVRMRWIQTVVMLGLYNTYLLLYILSVAPVWIHLIRIGISYSIGSVASIFFYLHVHVY